MVFCVFLLFLLSIPCYAIVCTNTQVYAKFSMQTGMSSPYEEGYVVKNGDTVLVTSPLFATEDLHIIEYCLTGATKNLYTLLLVDNHGDSWDDGSYLKIEGIYGNVVFKNFMTASYNETYTLSLYMPIKKADTWKMISVTAVDTWTQYSSSEIGWSEMVVGGITTTLKGTQYFRKTFVGIAGMAAYEARLKYRSGIVAYINGVEIYRDNVGDGAITSTSFATGSYTTASFHGFIRPGSEVDNEHSVFAVELHFESNAESASFDFDAFFALIMPTTQGSDCYIYGYGTEMTAKTGIDPEMAFDFYKMQCFTCDLYEPEILTYSFTGPIPYINGVRIWPEMDVEYQPKAFTWSGSRSTSTAFTEILSETDAQYSSYTYSLFTGNFHTNLYSTYKATIISVAGWALSLYEMQPVVCSISLPTVITFSGPYVFYAKYDAVFIKPVVEEFTGCTVANLPTGLTVNSLTCEVTGGIMTVMPATSYVMTSVMNGKTYTGSFSLEIKGCAGTGVEILRVYKGYSFGEGFSVKDSVTNDVVYSVDISSSQVDNVAVSKFLCLTGTKYTVTLSCKFLAWENGSFLYVNVKLSDDDTETILRMNFDDYITNPKEMTFNIQYEIPTFSQWKYMMSTVPASWTDSTVTGWLEGMYGTFTAPTNQIQLFKKIFDVSSTADAAGFVLSLQYKYGCAVYLNGVEVFTNGLTTPITTESTATTLYPGVKFHQISLPIKTMAIGTTAAVEYLHQGSNTLAIALVAISSTQTTVDFDCALRLMRTTTESRSHDVKITSENISGGNAVLNQSKSAFIYYPLCKPNHMDIIFNNDRREWISSVDIQLQYNQYDRHVRQFSILTRNNNEEEWTLIKTVNNLSWSLVGQRKKIWLENNKPWNQIRFENFATGNPSSCNWQIARIDLFTDCTTVVIPDLTYPDVNTVFQNIEMGEIYPSSELYRDFTIDKPLPAGLNLDPTVGVISGTATAISAASTYTISAKKFTGGDTTASLSLGVGVCFNGKNLITLVARIDANAKETSYKLYKGKGVEGPIEKQIDYFYKSATLNYGDFCVAHSIYTLQLIDSAVTGWSNPSGYYLTVDLGSMIFEMGQVPPSSTAPVLVTTMFSSFLPFQINYDNWKVWSAITSVDSTWKDVTYDDAAWRDVLAEEIGTSPANTVYIRKTVNIPFIDDYQVLNIRMKFVGGVAVHFNGRIVARFNLPETFDALTPGIIAHDISVFERFHIILTTAGGVTGNNVIAFEIHRPDGEPTSVAIIFDATGVFGVNECSIAVDSFTQIDGSKVSSCTLEELLDLNPVTFGYQPNSVGSYLEWTVSNLEGSKFNSFAMQNVHSRIGYGFSLYGRRIDEDKTEKLDYTSILALLDQSTVAMCRSQWNVPVGIAGFRQFKFVVDKSASQSVYISSYILQYCRTSGNFCPAVDDFPAVGEGQISPGPCPYGYKGYSSKTCTNGKLGDTMTDNCVYKTPVQLIYKPQRFYLVTNIQVHIAKPEFQNLITKFSLLENTFLPTGLQLNNRTGEITGIPTDKSDVMSYTIYGSNPRGSTPTVISISIRNGECKFEGNFAKTEVGKVAIYECSMKGNYVGSVKRPCVLGAVDGEWQKATGICVSVALIVLIVVLIVVMISVVTTVIIRISRKTKVVGGIKGRQIAVVKKIGENDKQAQTVRI